MQIHHIFNLITCFAQNAEQQKKHIDMKPDILIEKSSHYNSSNERIKQRKKVMPSQQLKDADYFIRILKQHLPEIREKYSVSYLGVFGSYVRGEQTSDSDLDVLVEFDKTPGLLKYIELEYYLSDLLGVKVDLVTRSGLKPNVGKHVLNEVVSL
jgi:predicted nucleotidyltransferase